MKIKLYQAGKWVADGWGIRRARADEAGGMILQPFMFLVANDEDVLKAIRVEVDKATALRVDNKLEAMIVADDRRPVKFGKDRKGEFVEFTGKPGVGETLALLEGKKYPLFVEDFRPIQNRGDGESDYVEVKAGFLRETPPEMRAIFAREE